MREDALQTRQAILETAFREIHRNGFRATGLADILKKTKLTKGAFYHHFPNKLSLGYAIVDELMGILIDKFWLDPLTDCEDPLACLKDILLSTNTDQNSVLLGCPLNNLAVEMAPVDEGFRHRLEAMYQKWINGLAAALSRGQTTGHVAGNVDTMASARFIVAAMAGCRSLAKNAQSTEMLDSCQKQLGRYLDSLRVD